MKKNILFYVFVNIDFKLLFDLIKIFFIHKLIVLIYKKNMARRRRRKTKIVLDKFKIWLMFSIIGWLYFFSLYLAKWSPVFNFLTKYAKIWFGSVWLNVFFALSMLTWIMILIKAHLIKFFVRQFIFLNFLISAILNFPIIDWISTKYEQYWWYFSFPLLYFLDKMFWWQAVAIKILILLILLGLIVWILYKMNFSLPKLNIDIKQEKAPKNTSKRKQEKRIAKKIADTKNRRSNSDKDRFSSSWKNINESSSNVRWNDDILKSIIKHKVKEKMKQKNIEDNKKEFKTINFWDDKPTYPLSLLDRNWKDVITVDEKFLMEKAKALQDKLMEFNVPVSIEWFDIWPSIVQIRVKPDAGIRVSSIERLASDVSLSLRTKSLRVIAPIPWTDSVWIQLPNPKPTMVRLWDVIQSEVFRKSMTSNTTNLTLWKWIDGTMIIKQLDKMPHLLVAWATWSWKSVWVNDFILSLMYQNSPSELKFLMIDPKQVELELYSWLPYMLWPIVTHPDKALKLLKRAVEEMEIRYSLLKKHRVKKLEEYNKKIIWEKMYKIVFVIDELADLMMSGNKKEVESCITRIAQKARAVWIHLIVATQRPSVNVITWLIKANMPTRIAFWVVSEIDSRTILWRKWAEDLVWKWDLLYIDPSTKRPIRIQAPYVDTKEIERVVQALKNKYMWNLTEDDIYHPEIIKMLEDNIEIVWSSTWAWHWWKSWDEELIQRAIVVISETRKASATLLQRKLNVWFARAARIMDALEERWIVWPQQWAKARDIYI